MTEFRSGERVRQVISQPPLRVRGVEQPQEPLVKTGVLVRPQGAGLFCVQWDDGSTEVLPWTLLEPEGNHG